MVMSPENHPTLSQLRDRAGLSLAEVANALKISTETLEEWESSEEPLYMEIWQAVKLTQLYGVSMEDLALADGADVADLDILSSS
jgi:DNA-binding transcriptional regulator YiaG